MQIGDYNFVCTCGACPEQYDVFDKDGCRVGYVRLRRGGLSVECPYCFGVEVYYAGIGDGWAGSFKSDKQRRIHLNRIVERIKRHNWRAICPECGEVHHMDVWSLDELDECGQTTIECAECEQEFTVKDIHGELVVTWEV